MEIKEKKKVIIDITKPEDIDNVKAHQWMHFTCKKCGKDTMKKFTDYKYLDKYKRMFCQNCNFKQNSLERYGVEHPSQLKEFQEKLKQTNLERYGVEYPLQSLEIQEKFKQTNLERHGVEFPLQSLEFQEKLKQTNLERYGVENPNQSPEIREKFKQTNLERYGVENPLQSLEIQEKFKQTNLERHGVEFPLQSLEFQEKLKQTNLERYGVENPLQSLEIQEKWKQTNLERYGVENPNQSPEIREKIDCKYKYFRLSFDSSWELYYYIYQTEVLKVNCVRNYGKVYFEYTVNGKVHRYIPDFINEGRIVEVKGYHLFKDGNLIDFYHNLTEEQCLAKTQCMLDNVDVIISEKEITPMIKEVKRLFGVHYIEQFKVNKDEEGLKVS